MVFLAQGNQHDRWLRFCEEHRGLLVETALPAAVTFAEHCFRDLLRDGAARAGRIDVSLASLSTVQWQALVRFTEVFFCEWESFAPLDLFPAFRRETDRRAEHCASKRRPELP